MSQVTITRYVVGEDQDNPMIDFGPSKRKAMNWAKKETVISTGPFYSLKVYGLDADGVPQCIWNVITGTVCKPIFP